MTCADPVSLSNREFLDAFNKKASQLRIPLSGSLDLTHRCNLRCVHCYLGPQAGCWGRQEQEMDTARILEIIDEITGAGCLHLLITGGEPLLRDDFAPVYSHAKKKGLLVTVFTNGTTGIDSVLDLFENLPPRAVEISLYGATASTYDLITGVPGSFDRCMKGISLLLERRIPVRLKTVLMTLNSPDFFAIADLAASLGVEFRFDAAIFPRLNGDRLPLGLRVSPSAAVEREFTNRERAADWKLFFEKTRGLPLSDRLYNCGAGLTGFHIDPYGYLQPCIMANKTRFDLAKGSFMEGWRGTISKIREKVGGKTSSCNHCERRHLCGFCPAFFDLENGSEEECSEYLCSIGHYRLQAIKNICSEGVAYAGQE
jgi:radical SAM protein with 4Fe4S-binding SPASM domain